MLDAEHIGFRAIEKEDLEILRAEHNDESVLTMLGDPFIVTESMQLEWWEKISSSRTSTAYCLYYKNPSNIIGVWRMQNFDVTNRNTEIGIDIFKKHRGKGLGLKSYEKVISYLFDSLNLHTIYARAGEYNKKSLMTLKKAGFKVTGKFSETLFKKGKYLDNIILCITVKDFRMQLKK